ncbi:MAG: hypothetical protein AB9907_03245 [Flexilinea sp.]
MNLKAAAACRIVAERRCESKENVTIGGNNEFFFIQVYAIIFLVQGNK